MGGHINGIICLELSSQDRLTNGLFLGIERVTTCKFIMLNWDIRGLLNHTKKAKPENLLNTTQVKDRTPAPGALWGGCTPKHQPSHHPLWTSSNSQYIHQGLTDRELLTVLEPSAWPLLLMCPPWTAHVLVYQLDLSSIHANIQSSGLHPAFCLLMFPQCSSESAANGQQSTDSAVLWSLHSGLVPLSRKTVYISFSFPASQTCATKPSSAAS